MEKEQSFQVSKGWYYALMTMLAAILLLRLSQTVGMNSFNWFMDKTFEESYDVYDSYDSLRNVVNIIGMVVVIMISVLYIVVFSKLAALSRKLNMLYAVGFILLVAFMLLTILLIVCNIIVPKVTDHENLQVAYNLLHKIDVVSFFLQMLIIFIMCIGLVLQGERRLCTAAVIGMLGALTLVFSFVITDQLFKALPYDSQWISRMLTIVGFSIGHILLVIGWARMITK